MIVKIIAAVIGAFLVLVILQDGFESVVLPRKVSRKFRFTRIFYVGTWNAWSLISRRIRQSRRREMFLSYYGPLSLILLLGIWAIVLIFGYTLLQWGADTALQAPEKSISFGSYLYMSGVIFMTLGFGDVVPLTALGRTLAILEAGTGFAFLALIIGYVPVIYQAFSRREVGIAQLDARAGSPSSPTELLLRHVHNGDTDGLTAYLHDWEIWCAEVLESHLSYMPLIFYRSQHEHQSWLAALTTILDTCALLLVGFEGISVPTARFTFAIARHTAVDLAQSVQTSPLMAREERLSPDDFARMRDALAAGGLRLRNPDYAERHLAELRRFYEPFVNALASHLQLNLPPWIALTKQPDDWQTSAWDHFVDWTPETINNIMRSVAYQKKKLFMRPEGVLNAQSQPVQQDEQRA